MAITIDAFDELPEPKIELIDGRVMVGNDDGDNCRLLHLLLRSWGAEAALCMADESLWWDALYQGFRKFDCPSPTKPMDVWRAWANQLHYQMQLPPRVGERWPHDWVRQTMNMGLYQLHMDHRFAWVASDDVVMRLGEDALTPDLMLIGPEQALRLNQNYLEGRADLVIEVLWPGQEDFDRNLKRRLHRQAQIPEYWLVDPQCRSVECLRLVDGDYVRTEPDASGRYRSYTFPHLLFDPCVLWQTEPSWSPGPNPFSVDGTMPAIARGFVKGGISWGDLPFDPRPVVEAGRLTFAEFISWATRSKFELAEGKLWVGGTRGARNVLGMLLRTEGLAEAVTLLHPQEWLTAIQASRWERREDATRRQHWWDVARRAADFLRAKGACEKIAIIGDLVHKDRPLNFWSDIQLVLFDGDNLPHEVSRSLFEKFRDEPDIDWFTPKHASKSRQEEIREAAVEI